MTNYNIINDVDSYKIGMWVQYPPKTEKVYSYIESRGGKYDELVFFGAQYICKKYLTQRVTVDQVKKSAIRASIHGEIFNYEGWMYIATELDGKLPIIIKALPEGSVVTPKNVMLTIENTDIKCYWLTTHIETMLLRAIWFPTTVASISHNIKKTIQTYLDKTGTPEAIDFKLHDFGGRGAHSYESASIGGLAHLISFKGTDTFSALAFAEEFYGMSNDETFGYSVPATEHSISTAWTKNNEIGYVKNHVEQSIKHGMKIFSIVADTYNVYNFVDMLKHDLSDWLIDILTKNNAKLVIRPDSGDPLVVPIEIIERLMGHFGYTVNEKGYKVLPSFLGVIQGDGINADSIKQILSKMEDRKLSADNIVFGMGGQLLGAAQRDDAKFAMKASHVVIDSVGYDIAKEPITDIGKVSKRGKFMVELTESGFKTISEKEGMDRGVVDNLITIFENGEIVNEVTFGQVIANKDVKRRFDAIQTATVWKNRK